VIFHLCLYLFLIQPTCFAISCVLVIPFRGLKIKRGSWWFSGSALSCSSIWYCRSNHLKESTHEVLVCFLLWRGSNLFPFLKLFKGCNEGTLVLWMNTGSQNHVCWGAVICIRIQLGCWVCWFCIKTQFSQIQLLGECFNSSFFFWKIMTQSVLLAREHFSIHILPSLSSLYSSTGGNMRLSFLHVIGTKPNLFCMIVFFETLFCMIVTCKELEQV